MVNTFVIAPNFSIEPPPPIPRTGDPAPPEDQPVPEPFSSLPPLQLGDVVADPFGPGIPALNRDERVPIHSDHVDRPTPGKNLRDTRKNLLSGRLGVWASLFAALGIGTELNISLFWESRSEEVLEIEKIETRTFRVTAEYCEKVLNKQSVKDFLTKFPGTHLYLVSGLKIANGAKVNSDASREWGGDAGGKDGTGTVDLKLLKFLSKRSRQITYEVTADFILGVQYTHIRLVEGKGDHTLSLKHGKLADGGPGNAEDAVPALEGTDDDLTAAEEECMEEIKKMDDGEGGVLMIADLEGE